MCSLHTVATLRCQYAQAAQPRLPPGVLSSRALCSKRQLCCIACTTRCSKLRRRSYFCPQALRGPQRQKDVKIRKSEQWGKASAQELQREDLGWQVFKSEPYAEGWNVPWGVGTLVAGVTLWTLSFGAVEFYAMPQLFRAAGYNIYEFDAQGKAFFVFTSQVVETVVTLSLIGALTKNTLADNPDPTVFNYSLSSPFKAPSGWAFWAVGGMILAPAVVGAAATLVTFLGYDQVVQGGRGTVDGVATMITMDLPTYVSLLAVTGALAPVLEETVFRGFLLASLTKFMPTWAAVVASSVTFGIAHLSSRDFPVLTALGILLGFSYVRSKNLLTPIVIHGAWNSLVLTILFALAASGLDLQELLQDIRAS